MNSRTVEPKGSRTSKYRKSPLLTSLFAGVLAAGTLASGSALDAFAAPSTALPPGLAAISAARRWDGAEARSVGTWEGRDARWWESWELSPDGSVVSTIEWKDDSHAITVWDAGSGEWLATAWSGTDLRAWMDGERILWRTDAEWKDWARATIWNLRAANAAWKRAPTP